MTHAICSLVYLMSMLTTNPVAERTQLIVTLADRHVEFVRAEIQEIDHNAAWQPIYDSPRVFRFASTIRQDWYGFFEGLRREGKIDTWYEDQAVEMRRSPDDPDWDIQWDMHQIGVDAAWEITTGGTTANGDRIVIAILDSGFEIAHPDLAKSFWHNEGEIPGDGIDNDRNGYIDDYRGINTQTANDSHTVTLHGTAVAGIIGAQGDNGLGVSGINWDVGLLPISGIQNESDVLAGYQYVKTMRQLYEESNGQSGAYVVATNLSAGIDNAFAEDHPIWCGVYDDLGTMGVLSVASTTNKDISVDEEGDMPSTCRSEYLIVVTNTDANDEKFVPAGYGPLHVDLGAPGSFSYTTALLKGYADFGNTSAAAPHVAGLVGLMYSVSCPDFGTSLRDNPGGTALGVKNVLLEQVYRLPSLSNISVAGGRVDAEAAVAALCPRFNLPADRLSIAEISPNPTRQALRLAFTPGGSARHEVHCYDSAGRLVLQYPVLPNAEIEYITLDVSTLRAGIYILAVSNSRNVDSHQIIVMP